MTTTTQITVKDLELDADQLDVRRAADIYREHGALVVRGLSLPYVAAMRRDMEELLATAQSLLPQAKRAERFQGSWETPDGSSFNEDPLHPGRMVVNQIRLNAMFSAAFTQALLNPKLLDVMEQILGPDIELWAWGQTVYRQPDSGVPKSLHQDEYYFEHKQHSSTAVLSYAIDVDARNSPLHIVPGSHKLGLLEHVDDKWAGFALADPVWWERSIPITGRAGDAIFFHGMTVHGSPANRSELPRPVFIKRYRRADDFCIINVSNVAGRKAAEQKPLTRKGDTDRGLMVRGLRRYLP